MLQKLKLGSKFNLLLFLVFSGSLILTGIVLSHLLENRIEQEVTSKAKILMETMTSVRTYTSTHIQPLLSSRLETEVNFIPETVPAYSATEIFNNFRKNTNYNNFFYKEATLNPTNLRDKADLDDKADIDETRMVNYFRLNTDKKELTGFREDPAGKKFYIARPLAVTNESCLECHSTPDRAPKSQITNYGSENGFGWKLNEIVAAQVIYVPAEEVISKAQEFWRKIMLIVISILLAIALLINYLLKHFIVKPIRQISRTAEAISLGQMNADFNHNSQDEIGSLAAAFNRMKSSLQISMNLLNKKAN
jgi:HAMP domain-containing protein